MFLNNIKDALAHTNLAVLYAQTKHGAIALLERKTVKKSAPRHHFVLSRC
jgi:hypothetical protein